MQKFPITTTKTHPEWRHHDGFDAVPAIRLLFTVQDLERILPQPGFELLIAYKSFLSTGR